MVLSCHHRIEPSALRSQSSTHSCGQGIVKLSECRVEEAIFLRDELGRSAGLGDLAPSRKGSLARSAAEVGRGGFGIRDVEKVRDLIVNRQKPLCLPGRFESLHNPFASPCRQVRVLRAIVQALVLAMFDAEAHLRPRSAVRTELVGDHDARRCDGGFQEPPHEPLRSTTVSSTLDQDIENEAILIDGAPKPVLLASNRDDDLIHMPFVAASRRTPADLIGERLAELLPPLAHGFVRHTNPARRQHFLDHAQAQGKPEIEPNGIADHFWRKAMAAIQRITGSRHGQRLAVCALPTR
jgi:hypothetical protein